MSATRRIRDPIHGLIRFEADSAIDQLAWELLDTREMQRLRSIKQLGFLHLVFPGATHTRFSHSVGVYAVARQLLDVIRRELGPGEFDDDRAGVVALAALLHDVGHGPLSHVFEKAERAVGRPGRHEYWSRKIVSGATEINSCLERARPGLAAAVADEICGEGPGDIYSAVVASHFDADRLDYIQRDQHMTGVSGGSIDLSWLLDCLRVEELPPQWVGDRCGSGLVLSRKGLRAAEEYLLARINLYRQIYLHKTSRGAELMLAALVSRIGDFIADGSTERTNLAANHPLIAHFDGSGTLSTFLSLSDDVLDSALIQIAGAGDHHLADLAGRLSRRKIYKCFDAGERIVDEGRPFAVQYRAQLRAKAQHLGLVECLTLLIDEQQIDAISSAGQHGPQSQRPVLVKQSPGSPPLAITEVSMLLAAVRPEEVMRFYVPTDENRSQLLELWRQTNRPIVSAPG